MYRRSDRGNVKHDEWRYPQIKTGKYAEYHMQSYRRVECRMAGLAGCWAV